MTKTIDLDTARALIKDFQLPQKPHLLIKIKKAYPELDEIAELISDDLAAASTVLRIVNSPMYATVGGKVSSVIQAVSMLGLEKVMNVVNSVLVANSLKSTVPESLLENYWLANHKVAIAAAELAKKVDNVDTDQAYMLALFHNSGIAMLLQKHPDYFDMVMQWQGLEVEVLDEHEERAFGISHSMLGYILAKSWGIDKSVAIAIREHHNLTRFTDASAQTEKASHRLLAVLKLAEHVAGEYEILTGLDDAEWLSIKEGILDFLEIDEFELEDYKEDILDLMEDSEMKFFS
jgi:HD-like signal output (HDOD) protein